MNERMTDLWVYDLLQDAKIADKLEPEKSSIKELQNALSVASKKGTGKVGKPEYIGVVKDFVIVIENKKDLDKHEKRDNNKLISQDQEHIKDYAINGALWYAKQIIANQNTYKKVFAIAVSGNSKRHKITPLFVDNGAFTREPLKDIEGFILLQNFCIFLK